MVSYWLMSPRELYDSTRMKELKRINPFGLPLEARLTLKVDCRFLPELEGKKAAILCYNRQGIHIPLGSKLLIHDSNDDNITTLVAEVDSVTAGPLKELYEKTEKKDVYLLPEENFFRECINLPSIPIGTLISISRFNKDPSDKEVMLIIRTMCEYNLTLHQKD